MGKEAIPGRLFTISTLIFFSVILFSSCKKKETSCNINIIGNYFFVTHATAFVGVNTYADTIINYAGYVHQESKDSVEIKYAPHFVGHTSPVINVEGTIHPIINDNCTFSYPNFISKNSLNFFSGNISDDGTIHIKFGFRDIGYGYTNDITGTRR